MYQALGLIAKILMDIKKNYLMLYLFVLFFDEYVATPTSKGADILIWKIWFNINFTCVHYP
jgi:hypothetical protein